MNLDSGRTIRRIDIATDKFRLDSNENILVWPKNQNKIIPYNNDGVILGNIEVEKDLFDFIVYKKGYFIIFKYF